MKLGPGLHLEFILLLEETKLNRFANELIFYSVCRSTVTRSLCSKLTQQVSN